MKKVILILSVVLLTANLFAQQTVEDEYGAFLNEALTAIKKGDKETYLNDMKWFTIAIEKNNITPENIPQKYFDLYTECLKKGTLEKVEFPDDMAGKAKIFLQFSIENKQSVDAMTYLAYFYENGYGVKQDKLKSFELYKKAADLGYKIAIRNVGVCYRKGIGVKKDLVKAEMFFNKAFNLGVKRCLLDLAFLYEDLGQKGKVEEYYNRAVEKNVKNAVGHLVRFYFDNKKYSKALFYEKKCNENDENCNEVFGYMYLNGVGVDVDYDKARKFYLNAGNDEETLVSLSAIALVEFQTKPSEQAFEEAKKYCFKAIDTYNSESGKLNLASLFYFSKNYAYAEEILYSLVLSSTDKQVKENAEVNLSIMVLEGRASSITKKQSINYLKSLCNDGVYVKGFACSALEAFK